MKIAHILWSLGMGGVETMLVDIANEQVKQENVMLFIINNVFDTNILKCIDSKIKIHFCKRTPGSKDPLPIIRFNLALWKYKPDIVHCHLDDQSKLIFFPFTLVRTIHNTHSECSEYSKFKRLFCISEGVKRYTATQGYPNGITIYNGIHPEHINCKPKGIFNDNVKHLLCVGRLHPDKGQEILIKAVSILVNNKHCNNLSIDLLGDGPERDKLEKLTIDYNITDYVHFLGSRPREYFYPIMCEYDMFIMPSISEGFGLTLAEACAAKLPVITADLEGPMEVIKEGKYGYTFQTGDANSLAEKIADLITKKRNESLIENAYKYVLENFNVKATAQKYITQYYEIYDK